MKPIIKWAGGKRRLIRELVRRMPTEYGTYYEPFFGGGALYWETQPWQSHRAVVGDANGPLMAMYSTLSHSADAVIDRLNEHAHGHSEDYYYRVREWWNSSDADRSDVDQAAAFIYLNRACFNGLYRVNGRGEFNVPWGDRTLSLPSETRLRAAGEALCKTTMRPGSYRLVISDVKAGDFVYMDPPYDSVEGQGFTGFTASGFGVEQQIQLASDVKTLVARGACVLLSNADTPRVRELYSDYRIDEVEASWSMAADGQSRSRRREVIVVAGYDPGAV